MTDRPTACPRCGSTDPAVRQRPITPYADRFFAECADEWHDRPTDDPCQWCQGSGQAGGPKPPGVIGWSMCQSCGGTGKARTTTNDLPARLDEAAQIEPEGSWGRRTLTDAAARIRELEAENAALTPTNQKWVWVKIPGTSYSVRQMAVEPDYKWAGKQQS